MSKEKAQYLLESLLDWVEDKKENFPPQPVVATLLGLGSILTFEVAPSIEEAKEFINEAVNVALKNHLRNLRENKTNSEI